MIGARSCGLGIVALWLSSSGCTKDADSCGGPTSDFPFCGDKGSEDAPPASRGPFKPGDPVDLDGDGTADGVAVDGNDDGQADGVDTNADGSGDEELPSPGDGGAPGEGGASCDLGTGHCIGETMKLDITGQAPQGAIHIDGVELHYTTGVLHTTELKFLADLDGERVTLSATLPGSTGEPWSPAAPVGVYTSGQPDAGVSFELNSCAEAQAVRAELAATLEVFEHSELSTSKAGQGSLKGELRVQQTGWELRVPFTLDQACSELIVDPQTSWSARRGTGTARAISPREAQPILREPGVAPVGK